MIASHFNGQSLWGENMLTGLHESSQKNCFWSRRGTVTIRYTASFTLKDLAPSSQVEFLTAIPTSVIDTFNNLM